MTDKKMDPDFIKEDNPDDFEGTIPKQQRGDASTLVELDNPDDSEVEAKLQNKK